VLSAVVTNPGGAAAAGDDDSAGTVAPATSLNPLLSPGNGLTSGPAQVVGGAVDGGAQVVGATLVGPALTPLLSSLHSVGSSVPPSDLAVVPGIGVTQGVFGTTTTTTFAGAPPGSRSQGGAAGSIASHPVMSVGAGPLAGLTRPSPFTASMPPGAPARRGPERRVPGVPTLFSLLATAGTTGSPSFGHGSSEGMPPMSALLPLLAGGRAPFGRNRHAAWLFDARGPPPG
jgi:hypothetical protein